MGEQRWIFSDEKLLKTPSRILGMNEAKEMFNRKLAAHFIHDLCGELRLSQICLNTAVVYMHRFYVCHSFTEYNKYSLATSALFVAAKYLDEHRQLELLILYAHHLIRKNKKDPSLPKLNTKSEEYALKEEEIILLEDLLLCTIGFELFIEHPHTYIVKICQLIKASEDLAKSAYVMASVSQCISTMCLQHPPDIIACICIHLVCEWRGYKIEPFEGKEWFYFVNRHITLILLNDLKEKFKVALDQKPKFFRKNLPKPKEKISSITIAQIHNIIANSEKMKAEELHAKKLTFVGIVQKADIETSKVIYFVKDNTGPGIEVHAGIRECAENNKLKIYSKNKYVRVVANIRSIDGKNCVAASNIQEVIFNNNEFSRNTTVVQHSSNSLKKHKKDSQASSSTLSSIENVPCSSSKPYIKSHLQLNQ